jgi:hypothetical protein
VNAEKKSFITSLPGLLTGVAGVITAVVGLVIALDQVGVIGGSDAEQAGGRQALALTATTDGGSTTADEWAASANEICARANDAIDTLPEPEAVDPASVGKVARQLQAINRRMLRDLNGLERPPEKQAEVKEFLRLGARLGDSADTFFAALRAGNVVAAQEQTSELSRLGKLFDASAIDLGANTCAEGASEIGL